MISGTRGFQVFIAQIGRRLAGDQRLVSEVLETIASNKPDLFAVAADEPLPAAPQAEPAQREGTREVSDLIGEDSGRG